MAKFLYYLLLVIIRNRILSIILLLGFLTLSITQLPKLTFDNTPDGFFMDGDKNLRNYEQFKEQFESDEFSLVLLDSPKEWNKEFIDAIESAVSEFEQLAHVNRVISITNVRNIESKDDEILIEDFFEGVDGAEEIISRQEKAVSHPHYAGLYVTEDGEQVAIVVETEILKGKVDYKVGLTQNLRRIAEEGKLAPYNPRVVGAPILDADVRNIVEKESSMFTAVSFVLIMIGFWVAFRSFYATFMAFTILVFSLLITFGLMSALGYPFTLLTPIVPTFLMSVGISSLVFLLSTFCYKREAGKAVDNALLTTFTEVGAICFMTTLTTAGALFAFSFSKIVPVFEVGVTMGAGLLIIFAVTMLLFPMFLGGSAHRFLKLSGSTLNKRIKVLVNIGEWVIKHYKTLLCGFVVIFGLAIIGIVHLKIDYHYLGIFKSSTSINKDYVSVDSELPTSAALEIILYGAEENIIKQPSVLLAMDQLSSYIAENSELPVKIYSLADVVKELNEAFHNGDADYYSIPSSSELISQELILFESSDPEEIRQLVDLNYQRARFTIRVPNVPDSQYRALLAVIDRGIEKFFKSNAELSKSVNLESESDNSALEKISIEKTGLVQLWVTISDYLTESQVLSVCLAFLVVTVVMMVIFKSIVMGLALGVLNLSVVIIVLGVMGAIGVYLDPYTILIAAIALGILDDDTIHFVRSVQESVKLGSSIEDGIRKTYAQAGQAIFYTTTILVISFSTYVFSSIASLTKFGLLIALTLILGLIIEFLVTPAIVMLIGKYIFKPAKSKSVLIGELVPGH